MNSERDLQTKCKRALVWVVSISYVTAFVLLAMGPNPKLRLLSILILPIALFAPPALVMDKLLKMNILPSGHSFRKGEQKKKIPFFFIK